MILEMENQQIVKQISGLTPLTIGNFNEFEKQVIISGSGLQIQHAADEKIRAMLKYLFILLGLKELPNEAEKIILITGIKNMLGKYTLDNIKNAVDLAMKNIITFDLNLYDKTFSVLYLNNLMSKYEAYRAATMLKYQKALEEEQLNERAPSEEEIKRLNFESVKNGCLSLFEKCKNKLVSVNEVDLSPEGVRYEFLKGLFNYTQEQVDEFREQAKEIISIELDNAIKNKKPGIGNMIPPKSEKNKLKLYIKNICVLDYFKTLLLTGRELEKEINNIKIGGGND